MKKLIVLLIMFCSIKAANAQINIIRPDVKRIEQQPADKKPVAFRLRNYDQLSLASSGSVTMLNLSLKEFDLSNSASGSAFTAPETGIYHLDIRLDFSFPISDYEKYLRFHLLLLKGSAELEKTTLMNPRTALTPAHSLMISTTLLLNKGEALTVGYKADAETGTSGPASGNASFSGFLVAPFPSGASATNIR